MNRFYRIAWFPLRRIYNYTMQYLAGRSQQRILDVGCGTGIYSIELAKRGNRVTALDACKEMIDATATLVKRERLAERLETVCGDYLKWSRDTTTNYDLVLAIGVMDSVQDALTHLESFRRMAGEIILTFPARSPLSPITEFSYRRHGIVGYSYTKEQVRGLLDDAGFKIVHFDKIFPGNYWVHARRDHQNASHPQA